MFLSRLFQNSNSNPQENHQNTNSQTISKATNMNKFSAYTTRSSAVRKAYVNSNVLSIFADDSYFGNLVLNEAIVAEECLSDFRFGKQTHKNHDQWHKNKKDFEVSHSHFVTKNKKPPTPDEFQCLLDNIMRFQKGYPKLMQKYNSKINLTHYDTGRECVNLKEMSLLTQADRDHLLKEYNRFYFNEDLSNAEKDQLEKEIQSHLDNLNQNILESLGEAGKSFLHSFLNTIVHRYIKPSLITQNQFNYKNVVWACDIMTAAIDLALTRSPFSAGFDIFLRNIIKPALLKIGVNVYRAEAIAERLTTALTITQNPLSLIHMTMNYSMADLGARSAYAVIHALPKLKDEPKASHFAQDIAEVVDDAKAIADKKKLQRKK